MRVTLLVALAAACIGVAGGLTDSTPLLTLATLISTFGFAALPLSQSIVLAGEVSPADAAAKLGLLSVVDATASAAGVQIGFVALGDIAQYGDGSRLTAASCAVAAAVGLAGWLALQSEDVKASRTAPPTRPYSYEPERPQVIAAAVLALSAAVAMPSALVQRSLDQTFDSPMWLERTVEGVMRAAVQGVGVAALTARVPSLSAKGAALAGGGALVAGALVSAVSLLTGVQKLAHHMMLMGIYAMETAGYTLVALGASACARPAARRAVSLLMLHMLVTLGPALLPILGWLAESTVGKWVQLALFPLMLICLVPHLDQLVYSAP